MTEEPSSRSERHFVWLAVAAMSCLLLLALAALATAFLLGRNQPLISINNGSNNQGASAAPVAVVAQPALPLVPTAASPVSAGATRPAPPLAASAAKPMLSRMGPKPMEQTPPYYETLSPVAKVQFRVRAQPKGPENMRGPVPFRVRQYQPASDGRVASVYAQKPAAGEGVKAQTEAYSFLPDSSFAASVTKGKDLNLEVTAPRKSSMVNGLRAPKGFQFLVAELRVSNSSPAALSLDPDAFEVRDSDGMSYLVNPELLGAAFPRLPLAAGGVANFQIAFLVPADANLVSLVATLPGGAEQASPLHPI